MLPAKYKIKEQQMKCVIRNKKNEHLIMSYETKIVAIQIRKKKKYKNNFT